jgi:hypothetical protein
VYALSFAVTVTMLPVNAGITTCSLAWQAYVCAGQRLCFADTSVLFWTGVGPSLVPWGGARVAQLPRILINSSRQEL